MPFERLYENCLLFCMFIYQLKLLLFLRKFHRAMNVYICLVTWKWSTNCWLKKNCIITIWMEALHITFGLNEKFGNMPMQFKMVFWKHILVHIMFISCWYGSTGKTFRISNKSSLNCLTLVIQLIKMTPDMSAWN